MQPKWINLFYFTPWHTVGMELPASYLSNMLKSDTTDIVHRLSFCCDGCVTVQYKSPSSWVWFTSLVSNSASFVGIRSQILLKWSHMDICTDTIQPLGLIRSFACI